MTRSDTTRFRKTLTRRQVLAGAARAGVGAGVWIATGGLLARAPSETLDVAFIGIGGRGAANLGAISSAREVNVVALCDVDGKRAGKSFDSHPKARRFRDFRRLYDALAKKIDAVVISTPDHTHFHPARAALQLGKHLYLEKPMAHSVWEVRELTRLAAEKRLVTQLGVQRHALDNVHRVVELVTGGAIGAVRECWAWVGGDRGMPPIPTDTPPVPAHLSWDLWLGPARARPYSPAYCPYKWRFWWDFGTGETGNWGCHILDLPFWALDLKYPTRAEGSGPPVHEQTTPRSMATRFEFPARAGRPPVVLHWHHRKTILPICREHGMPHLGSGVLFVGSKGMLLCDFHTRRLYPEKTFEGFEPPPRSIPDSPGFHREWIDACRGRATAPPTCRFDYSGPLTETVLLGNVAYRAGEPFEWNAAALEARGSAAAAALIRPHFRKGWTV